MSSVYIRIPVKLVLWQQQRWTCQWARARRQMLAPFSVSFHLCCHAILPVFQVCLSVSNKLTKKTLHRHAQQLGVWLVPDAVKLTSKMSHNTRGIPKQLGLGKRKWQWESKVHRDREQRSGGHRGGGGVQSSASCIRMEELQGQEGLPRARSPPGELGCSIDSCSTCLILSGHAVSS